jgi:putative methyltransferase (TIGR04325 family)
LASVELNPGVSVRKLVKDDLPLSREMAVRFCTLFDQRYATRGLVMLDSLERFRRPQDEVVVLAMDEPTRRLLESFGGGRWRIVNLEALTDDELLAAQSTRPHAEFCWTCTPALSNWMVSNSSEGDVVVYLDSDLCFFADPRGLLAELGEHGTVLIHEHRFSPDRISWEPTSGRFNVGFVAFRVGPESRACVERWRAQTIERCERDPEKGYCGDQGYLNEWPGRYPNLRIMKNVGGGVAPWNVNQYTVGRQWQTPTVDGKAIIFYHYHSLRMLLHQSLGFAVEPAHGYEFPATTRAFIYRPYAKRLGEITKRVERNGLQVEPDRTVTLKELNDDVLDHRYVAAGPVLAIILFGARGLAWGRKGAEKMRTFVQTWLRRVIPRVKYVLYLILPPIAVAAIGRVRRSFSRTGGRNSRVGVSDVDVGKPEWEAVRDTDAIWTDHEGWSHQTIADTQLEKWPAFLASVDGKRPFGWPHEAKPGAPIDVSAHNTILTFGYVLGRVAIDKPGVSVLDWGGGLGHYHVYARRLMPELKLDYVVKDLPTLCKAGRILLPGVEFICDDGEALSRRYDLVFASSSLQYARDYYGLLAKLCEAAGEWLMITRSPFVEDHDDFVVVQRPHKYGYMTEYPGWFVNASRFVAFVESHGFLLDREFMLDERPHVRNAPEQCRYRGFLFRRLQVAVAA